MVDDELDMQILYLLQKNGKLTYEEMAEAVGRPPSTVRDRIKRMEGDRVILGYATIIDHQRIGIGADVFVSADIPPDKVTKAFAVLFSMECVSEILRITGERRIMFRMRAADSKELLRIIDRQIRPLGFTNMEIQLIMEPLVRFPGL